MKCPLCEDSGVVAIPGQQGRGYTLTVEIHLCRCAAGARVFRCMAWVQSGRPVRRDAGYGRLRPTA